MFGKKTKDNQKWTIPRLWETLRSKMRRRQTTKNTTQKTKKMRNTESTKKKRGCSSSDIRNLPCY